MNGTGRDFYSERSGRGRREYRCQFCREAIAKGALHVCVSSGSAGQYHTHRAHTDCHEAASGQAAPAPAGVSAAA
jgi:hypothetical protein